MILKSYVEKDYSVRAYTPVHGLDMLAITMRLFSRKPLKQKQRCEPMVFEQLE